MKFMSRIVERNETVMKKNREHGREIVPKVDVPEPPDSAVFISKHTKKGCTQIANKGGYPTLKPCSDVDEMTLTPRSKNLRGNYNIIQNDSRFSISYNDLLYYFMYFYYIIQGTLSLSF